MIAKIYKIDPLKVSRSEREFKRIYFILEDGKWAKTDVVPGYMNYKRWAPIIRLFESGYEVFVEGVILRQKEEIDADSPVEISLKKFEIKKTKGVKFVQEQLL